MALQFFYWKSYPRVQEAASVPYRSFVKGPYDKGTEALYKFQLGVILCGGLTGPGGVIGPFSDDLGGEFPDGGAFETCFFGPHTEKAVRDIQTKLKLKLVDGIAGIETINAMDKLLVAVVQGGP